MTKNAQTAFPTRRWEEAIAGRKEVALEQIHLHHGLVCGASGQILDGGWRRAKWLHDGTCFCQGKRIPKFDINL